MDKRLFDGLHGEKRGRVLPILAGLAAVEALAAAAYLLAIPSEQSSSVLLGYSAQRLALVGMMLAAFVALAVAAIGLLRRQLRSAALLDALWNQPRRAAVWTGAAAGLFLVAWVMVFVPVSRWGAYAAYVERLHPLLVWWLAVCGQMLAVLVVGGLGLHPDRLRQTLQERPRLAGAIAFVLALLLVLWGLVAVTGVGLVPDDRQWNETGIPLLGLQVLAAWLAGLLVWWARPTAQRRTDWMICLALWALAAGLWLSVPQPRTYFTPGPYLPSNSYYPFSDAATFDASGQYALIGQGLRNGTGYDRPLYLAFLALLHAIAGAEYEPVIILQVLVLAVLPVLFYLLGKRLHSRTFGVMVGVLSIFREFNAIQASSTIQTSNSRLLLTEVPTLVGMLAVTLLWVYWLQSPRKQTLYAVLTGGALALTTLLRSNPLFLVLAVPVITWLADVRNWRRWLAVTVLFVVSMMVCITPWMVRNAKIGGDAFFYVRRFEDMFRYRYKPAVKKYKPTPTASVGNLAVQPTPTTAGDDLQPTAEAIQPQANDFSAKYGGVLRFTAGHSLHNLISTLLILPQPFQYDDLPGALTAAPYWQPDWNGQLTLPLAAGLMFNLAVLAVGLGTAWDRWRWAGWLPLIAGVGYHVASGLARTSGGRYLIPADWVGYFYFALGLLQITIWLAAWLGLSAPREEAVAESSAPARPRSVVLALVGFFLVGLSFPVGEALVPRRYVEQTPDALLQQAVQTADLGASLPDLQAFLQQPDAVILQGRELYPRYYGIDQGESERNNPYVVQQYPRLVFTLIGPRGTRGVVLPLSGSPDLFPSGQDVLVLGCKGSYVVQALVVVATGDDSQVYRREPSAPLRCPVAEPVCDNNRNCRPGEMP